MTTFTARHAGLGGAPRGQSHSVERGARSTTRHDDARGTITGDREATRTFLRLMLTIGTWNARAFTYPAWCSIGDTASTIIIGRHGWPRIGDVRVDINAPDGDASALLGLQTQMGEQPHDGRYPRGGCACSRAGRRTSCSWVDGAAPLRRSLFGSAVYVMASPFWMSGPARGR